MTKELDLVREILCIIDQMIKDDPNSKEALGLQVAYNTIKQYVVES